MKERLEGLAGSAARRPVLTVSVVVAIAIAGALLALRLTPSAGTDTFVSRSNASFTATTDDQKHFGSDAVVVLIKEPLTDLVETKDLATVTFLEACLAGQYVVPSQQLKSFAPAPPGAHAPYGGYSSPCGHLAKYKPVRVVYGPGTFLNRAVAAVNEQVLALERGVTSAVKQARASAIKLALARGMSRKQAQLVGNEAAQLAQAQQQRQLAILALNSGISGTPRIDDPQFIPQIVFDQTRGVNQPKARFAYLFPTANAALIQVRLKAGLSYSQQSHAISWIRQAVDMPMFRLGYGGTYTVTGAPVVINDLASTISDSIAVLLIAALAVMAVTLLLVFRARLRLLPLAVALAAAGITFGALSLVGGSLTMASIAVLPILIGLAVDYAIQFQSRAQEEPGPAESAVTRAARLGAPTIAAAALATATGFLVLELSPVPMVRGFGLLLVAGIVIAFACTLTGGSAVMVLASREGGSIRAAMRGAGEIVRPALRGAGEIMREIAAPVGRVVARLPSLRGDLVGRAMARPRGVLALGALLAILGWVADTQTSVQSDVTKLVPSNMTALKDLHALERVTGVSGEVDVVVHAGNVATPATINWMKNYENGLFSHYGYLETKGCARSTLCPALSLPDLFGAGTTNAQSGALSAGQIRALLAAVPPYFSQAVITPDHREATLAFGIRLMPLSKQERVLDYMRSQLHPPPGVTAALAGIPVLAAQANAELSSPGHRLLMLLAGLVAVGLVLLLVLRRVERALVPLIPIALATGWSALILWSIGIPLNPMSATLGSLVIAISTEFSVLLSERFRQERAAGFDVSQALARTYRNTGAAVLASGITAIMGFAVLIFSSIKMLQDFGFVTLIDLTVSLAGVLLVLPAVLVVSERRDLLVGVRGAARSGAGAWPRPRRRAPVA